jgi:hypothetical protein
MAEATVFVMIISEILIFSKKYVIFYHIRD